MKYATEVHVMSAIDLGIELHLGAPMCAGCRRALQNAASKRASLMDVEFARDDQTSAHDLIDDDDFQSQETDAEELNKLLKSLKLPTVVSSELRTEKSVQSVVNNANEKICEVLKTVTGINALPGGSTCVQCRTHIASIMARYKELQGRDERYKLLTSLPDWVTGPMLMRDYGVSKKMAEKAIKLRKSKGYFSSPPPKLGNPLSSETISLVRNFYLSPEVSRISPNMRDVMNVQNVLSDGTRRTEKVSKQQLLETLDQLYSEFKQQHSTVKLSKASFRSLKPRQCQWGKSKGFQQTCLCTIHSNLDLMLSAVSLPLVKDGGLELFLCDGRQDRCFLNMCERCPNWLPLMSKLESYGDEVEYWTWANIQGEGVDIHNERVSKDEFTEKFQQQLVKVADHHLVYMKQKSYLKDFKKFENEDETLGILHVDFAQNYTFILPQEVQSSYWSNNQCTLLPFVLTYYSLEQKKVCNHTFTVISDYMKHEATCFHIFRHKIIKEHLQAAFPQIRKLVYVSDGTGAQFKNFHNFANLAHHFNDYQIEAKWVFTATAHGKSLCDAMGALAKRLTRLESLRRTDRFITTAEQMASFLAARSQQRGESNKDYIFISKDDVHQLIEFLKINERYTSYRTIPGTRQIHDIEPVGLFNMKFKKYSSHLESTTTRFSNVVCAGTPVLTVSVKVGDYAAFNYYDVLTVGLILAEDRGSGDFEFQFMRKCPKGSSYKWSNPTKCAWVGGDKIYCSLLAPSTAYGRVFHFEPSEIRKATAIHNIAIKKS